MAKIIVAVSGLKGMLFSSFGIVQRLEEDGHKVVLASPTNVKDWTVVNGFSFLQLPNFFSDSLPKKVIRKCLNILSKQTALERKVMDLNIDELTDVFEAEQADLLLCDLELHEIILAAYKINLKTVLLSQFFNLAENHHVPTIQSKTNPDEKNNFSEEWEELIKRKKREETTAVNRKMALLEKAKELNFPIKHWQQYTWPLPFAYINFPTISITLEKLDFYQEDEYFHYVGHPTFENRRTPENKEFPYSFFKTKKESGSTIILVTLSTMKTSDGEFIKRLDDIAKNHPDWEIVVNSSASEIEKTENLHLFKFIPQPELLKISDLSVNHGGINTINECIYFQVPMIIIPGHLHDQNGNAARCYFNGIAIYANSDNLESVITDSLQNSELKQSMERFHQINDEYRESKRLEKIVNQYLVN